MAELKTKLTDASAVAYLDDIEDESRRADCIAIKDTMERLSGHPPRMWGDSMIGFGLHRYRYASGRELDWPEIAFASRKRDITLYLTLDVSSLEEPLSRLGKHRVGKGCIYIKRLSDVDGTVLEELISESLRQLRQP